MKDKDNYDYLRGFVAGFETDKELADKDDLPEGFNNLNEVWDRVYELGGQQNAKVTIVNVEVEPTKHSLQSKCKFELSNGECIMFLFPSNLTLKDWEKL